jgi:cysteine desulfurase
MLACLNDAGWGNPSSVHAEGRRARRILDEARESLLSCIPMPAGSRVIWCSGATEASNILLQGIKSKGYRVLVSATAHPSATRCVPEESLLPVTAAGQIDLEHLEVRLRQGASSLVSAEWVNSETGIVQPVEALGQLVHHYGGLLHLDATQGLGQMPFPGLGLVHALSVSAHKTGGPPGTGALLLAPGVEPLPLMAGGTQEDRLRPGTPNLPGIAGFQAALEALEIPPPWSLWRSSLIRTIRERLPSVVVHGLPEDDTQAPHILSLALPGADHQVQLMHLDMAGIAVSAGSACTSGKTGPSRVLQAMGVPDALARQTIRVSWGWNSTPDHLDVFLDAWHNLKKDTSS